MRRARLAYFLACCCLLATRTDAARPLSAEEAKNHVGENATVCGVVASARHAPEVRGQPTFLNLDKPYPNRVFTIVIWGDDRARFGQPDTEYAGKRICVTGVIESYKGRPEIVARQPEQVRRVDP